MHMPFGRHLDRLPGSWVATHAGDPDLGEKAAEPPQLYPVALRKPCGNLVQDCVESRFNGMGGKMRMRLAKLCKQL